MTSQGTKIYIAEGSEIESHETFGVWSSLELAKKDLTARATKDIIGVWEKPYWTYIVTEWDLDGKETCWWRLEYTKERGIYWVDSSELTCKKLAEHAAIKQSPRNKNVEA